MQHSVPITITALKLSEAATSPILPLLLIKIISSDIFYFICTYGRSMNSKQMRKPLPAFQETNENLDTLKLACIFLIPEI